MKRLFLLFSVLASFAAASAQKSDTEVVYLKDGSIIKGEVVEQTPGVNIKVRTKDGSLFVYDEAEVQKIVKEEKAKPSASGHRGLDFNVDLGYNVGKGGGGNVSLEAGFGKRFNKNFYFGVGTGAFINTDGGKPMIPATADFRVYFPLANTTVVPGGMLKLGYVANLEEDVTVSAGGFSETVEIPDYVMLQIMPAMQIPLSSKIDFNFAAGYTHFIPVKGGYGGGNGMFTVKAGFGFHKPFEKGVAVPTRDKGFQLTLEAGTGNPWKFGGDSGGYGSLGGTILAGYKINPNISVGLGYSYGAFYMNMMCESNTAVGASAGESFSAKDPAEGKAHDIFLRGQYRFTDGKLSPFVACDLGVRKYGYNDPDWVYAPVDGYDFSELEPKKSNFYIAPAVGLSLRTTNNSYLELKVGYDFASKLKEQTALYNETGEPYIDGEPRYMTYKSASMSSLFVRIGFTHTFNWLSGL